MLPVEPRGRADRPDPRGARLGRRHPDQPRRAHPHERGAARRARSARAAGGRGAPLERLRARGLPAALARVRGSPSASSAASGRAATGSGSRRCSDCTRALERAHHVRASGSAPQSARRIPAGRCCLKGPSAGRYATGSRRRRGPALAPVVSGFGGGGWRSTSGRSWSSAQSSSEGALDKALEDYQNLLKADPKDSNLRLKVGDLHSDQGKLDEAVNAYLRVAEQYTREGFDAKAVALYKQISRLDPKRHGRLRAARRALRAHGPDRRRDRRAADRGGRRLPRRRQGRRARAAAPDGDARPREHASRLKVAELFARRAARRRRSRSTRPWPRSSSGTARTKSAASVLERMLAADPERVSGAARRGARQARHESVRQRAQARRAPAGRCQPDDMERREILGHALRRRGRRGRARARRFRELAELYRLRGDEGRARDLMQRFGGLEALGESRGRSRRRPRRGRARGGDLLDDDSAHARRALPDASDSPVLRSRSRSAAELETPSRALRAPRRPGGPAADRAATECPPRSWQRKRSARSAAGRPRTSCWPRRRVYLRYGKHERAVARAAQHPGAGSRATAPRSRISARRSRARRDGPRRDGLAARGEGARAAGDAEALARIRERIAGSTRRRAAGARARGGRRATHDDRDRPRPRAARSRRMRGSDARGGGRLRLAARRPRLPGTTSTSRSSRRRRGAAPAPEPDPPARPRSRPSPPRARLAHGDAHRRASRRISRRPSSTSSRDCSTSRAPSTSASSPPRRTIRRRCCASARSRRAAAGRRASAPAAPAAAAAPVPLAPPPALKPIEIARPISRSTRPRARPARPRRRARRRHRWRRLRRPSPCVRPSTARAGADRRGRAPRPHRAARSGPARDAGGSHRSRASSGIAAAARQRRLRSRRRALVDRLATTPVGRTLAGTEEEAFEQVFDAFKSGVERQLGEGDHEARYDLGIAYKEMGLLDDAIAAFQLAMGAPERKLACLHMMGLCALDLGRAADAVAHLEQALSLPDLPSDQRVPLRYDVARAYGALGDVARARAAFEEVRAADPGFGDVEQELAALASARPAAATGRGETYESFDDLLAETPVPSSAQLATSPSTTCSATTPTSAPEPEAPAPADRGGRGRARAGCSTDPRAARRRSGGRRAAARAGAVRLGCAPPPAQDLLRIGIGSARGTSLDLWPHARSLRQRAAARLVLREQSARDTPRGCGALGAAGQGPGRPHRRGRTGQDHARSPRPRRASKRRCSRRACSCRCPA